MPTATAITFDFPWQEMLGMASNLITGFYTPIAVAGGILLVFALAPFAISLIKRGTRRN